MPKPKLSDGVFEKETPATDKPHLPKGMFKAESMSFKDKIIAVLLDMATSLKAQKPPVVNVEAQPEPPMDWVLKKTDKKTWILTARKN